jgi:dihydroflavonol-4-reductase
MTLGPTRARLGPSNGLLLAYLSDPTRSTFKGGCNIAGAADIGDAHLLLAERGTDGEAYLLGGDNLGWHELHREIGHLAGVGGPHVELDAGIAGVAATIEEWRARLAGRSPLSTREEAGMLGRYYWYDHDKAARLGYRPARGADAILETLSWLVTTPHVSRELRTSLRLHEAIYHHRYAGAGG